MLQVFGRLAAIFVVAVAVRLIERELGWPPHWNAAIGAVFSGGAVVVFGWPLVPIEKRRHLLLLSVPFVAFAVFVLLHR
jgi:hypothetical protein